MEGGSGAASALLGRCRGDRSRWCPWRHRAGHHGAGPADHPARGGRHRRTVTGGGPNGATPAGASPAGASPAAAPHAVATPAVAPLLVVADFDGTLAAGSRDHGKAHIDPVAQRALRHLARIAIERPGRIAPVVLTGRTVLDVAARVRVGGLEYLADHGLQSAVLP